MKQKTVNLIERSNSGNLTVRAFNDDEAGNKEVEKLFKQILKENYSLSDEEAESYVEDGFYGKEDYELYIVHSE